MQKSAYPISVKNKDLNRCSWAENSSPEISAGGPGGQKSNLESHRN